MKSHFLWWWPPWTLTRWWIPRITRGGDEWCNDSLVFVVPPVGAIIVFWRVWEKRVLPCANDWRHMDMTHRADYAPCGWLHGGHIDETKHHHDDFDSPCDEAWDWLRTVTVT